MNTVNVPGVSASEFHVSAPGEISSKEIQCRLYGKYTLQEKISRSYEEDLNLCSGYSQAFGHYTIVFLCSPSVSGGGGKLVLKLYISQITFPDGNALALRFASDLAWFCILAGKD